MKLTLTEWRKRRGMTQTRLANEAGVSIGTVLSIESGDHHPHVGIAGKLAGALGIGIDDVEWPPMKATGYGVPKPRKERKGSEAGE